MNLLRTVFALQIPLMGHHVQLSPLVLGHQGVIVREVPRQRQTQKSKFKALNLF